MEKDGFHSSPSSASKKVRFDLKHEVFVIPSKWDNLTSKTRNSIAREKWLNEITSISKTRSHEERSRKPSKSKQYRSGKQIKHNGKTHKKRNSLVTKTLITERRGTKNVPELGFSRSSAPKGLKLTLTKEKPGLMKAINPRTGHSHATASVKLKMTHRDINDYTPKVNIVLPKITYTPDLKRVIEKALTRSKHFCEEGAHLTGSSANGGLNLRSKKPVIREKQPSGKLSHSGHGGKKEGESLLVANDDEEVEQIEKNVHQLSENVEKWLPFPAWNEMAQPNVSNRKEKSYSIIPDSILY